MQPVHPDLSLANPHPHNTSGTQKAGVAAVGLGLAVLLAAAFGAQLPLAGLWLAASLLLLSAGTVVYARATYRHLPEGIKNNGVWHKSLSNRGLWAWMLGVALTGFYVLLYWFPQYLGLGAQGAGNGGLVGFFDPLSRALSGNAASQWFVYGTLYTIAILFLGIKFMYKYRHNRYQLIRTVSVMFFQLCLAFMLPELLARLSLPYNDFKNMWPLNYYFFFDWNIKAMIKSGTFGLFMLGWGLALTFFISPILTYFYGKRWYCSWVCGCGGLAETAGDPFRHLSDKSLNAWRIERWLVHLVLVFAVVMTVAILYTYLTGAKDILLTRGFFAWLIIALCGVGMAVLVLGRRRWFRDMPAVGFVSALSVMGGIALLLGIAHFSNSPQAFSIKSQSLREWYGFFIGAAFSGVIGVGFYPLLGSRVWCRFGCPMAAILGLQQRFFSRFRITTNGGQCISCGNCSAYCEMGIDVRAYAQRGQNIVRASCVGCGICAAVCPRGVLRLENSAIDLTERTTELKAFHLSEKNGVQFMG
jgi:Pyruvate/2-oxoacid:ferredoxin oxidoreductase delta subunit